MHVPLRQIAQAAQHDPKKALLDAAGDMSGFEPFHNQVLVATYIEPEMTAGGIIKPDRTLAENRFQGKAALVLKVGPLAFKEQPPHYTFGGVTIKAGDWVVVRPADGFEMFKGKAGDRDGASVRLFQDVNILARVADPSTIY